MIALVTNGLGGTFLVTDGFGGGLATFVVYIDARACQLSSITSDTAGDPFAVDARACQLSSITSDTAGDPFAVDARAATLIS